IGPKPGARAEGWRRARLWLVKRGTGVMPAGGSCRLAHAPQGLVETSIVAAHSHQASGAGEVRKLARLQIRRCHWLFHKKMLAGAQCHEPTIEVQLRVPEDVDNIQLGARERPARIPARLKESESLAGRASARGLQVAYVSENDPPLVPQAP